MRLKKGCLQFDLGEKSEKKNLSGSSTGALITELFH